MNADIPEYEVESPPLYESSGTSIERIRFNEGKAAVQKTIIAQDFSDALSELQVHMELSSLPNYFPKLLFHRTAQERGMVLLIMEYCEKRDLAMFIKRKRYKWDVNQLHVVMLQLLKALLQMHLLGISHGNLKPENVFISKPGCCKIGDFGKAVKHKYKPEKTRSKQDLMLDFQKDVFDLGKTFLECFSLRTDLDLDQKPESEVEGIIESVARDYPPGFPDLVKRMMKKDPTARVTIAEAFELLGSLPLPSARLSETNTASLHSLAINSSNIQILLNEQDSISTSRSSITGSIHSPPHLPVSTRSSLVLREQLQSNRNSGFSISAGRVEADREFAIAAGKVEVIVKSQDFNEDFLRTEVEKLIAEHRRLRGMIQVRILTTERICKDCRSGVVPWDTVELPGCGCVLCRVCLNKALTSLINYGKRTFSMISCPCCNSRFNPFEPWVKVLLSKDVVGDLDLMFLEETTRKCPKCDARFEKPEQSDCIRVTCPNGHKFCSYCNEKPHRFTCKKWRKDQKRAMESLSIFSSTR